MFYLYRKPTKSEIKKRTRRKNIHNIFILLIFAGMPFFYISKLIDNIYTSDFEYEQKIKAIEKHRETFVTMNIELQNEKSFETQKDLQQKINDSITIWVQKEK